LHPISAVATAYPSATTGLQYQIYFVESKTCAKQKKLKGSSGRSTPPLSIEETANKLTIITNTATIYPKPRHLMQTAAALNKFPDVIIKTPNTTKPSFITITAS
jgi:hypothetical protein